MNTRYYALLVTVMLSGTSGCAFSNDPDQVPSSPVALSASPLADGVLLSWRPADTAVVSAFRVFQGTHHAQLRQALEANGTATSALIMGLTSGVTYYFSVAAQAADGSLSPLAIPVTIRMSSIADQPPLPPSELTAEAGDGVIHLSWWPSTDPDLWRYAVLRGTSPTALSELTKLDAQVVAYDDRAVDNDARYYYAITAIDQGNHYSPLSGVVTATPGDSGAPMTPRGLIAVPGQGRVQLHWQAALESDIALHGIYVGAAEDELTLWSEVPGTSSSADVLPLTNRTTYFFALRAHDQAGNSSPFSPVVAAVPSANAETAPPPPPVGLTLTPGDGRVLASWRGPVDTALDHFLITYGRAPGMRSHTLDAPPTTSWSWIADLPNGLTTFAAIQSVGANGQVSIPSLIARATPQGRSDFPLDVAATATGPQATWQGVPADCERFDVRWSRREVNGEATTIEEHRLNRAARIDQLTSPWPCVAYRVRVTCIDDGDTPLAAAESADMVFQPAGSHIWRALQGSAGIRHSALASHGFSNLRVWMTWPDNVPGSAELLAIGEDAPCTTGHACLLPEAGVMLALGTDGGSLAVLPTGTGMRLGAVDALPALACSCSAPQDASTDMEAEFFGWSTTLHDASLVPTQASLRLRPDGTGSFVFTHPPAGAVCTEPVELVYRLLPEGRLDVQDTVCGGEPLFLGGQFGATEAVITVEGGSWSALLGAWADSHGDASSDGDMSQAFHVITAPIAGGTAIQLGQASVTSRGAAGSLTVTPFDIDRPTTISVGELDQGELQLSDNSGNRFKLTAGSLPAPMLGLNESTDHGQLMMLVPVGDAVELSPLMPQTASWLHQADVPTAGSEWACSSSLGQLSVGLDGGSLVFGGVTNDGAQVYRHGVLRQLHDSTVLVRLDSYSPEWLIGKRASTGGLALASAEHLVLSQPAPDTATMPEAGQWWGVSWRQVLDQDGTNGYYPLHTTRSHDEPLTLSSTMGQLAGEVISNWGGGVRIATEGSSFALEGDGLTLWPTSPYDGGSFSQRLDSVVAGGTVLAAATSLATYDQVSVSIPMVQLLIPATDPPGTSWEAWVVFWVERQGAEQGSTTEVSWWDRWRARIRVSPTGYQLLGTRCRGDACTHERWVGVIQDLGQGRYVLAPPTGFSYPPLQFMISSASQTVLVAGVDSTVPQARAIGWGVLLANE